MNEQLGLGPEEDIPPEAYEVEKEGTTCWNCVDNKTCKFAWDPYNTDGDCLADK